MCFHEGHVDWSCWLVEEKFCGHDPGPRRCWWRLHASIGLTGLQLLLHAQDVCRSYTVGLDGKLKDFNITNCIEVRDWCAFISATASAAVTEWSSFGPHWLPRPGNSLLWREYSRGRNLHWMICSSACLSESYGRLGLHAVGVQSQQLHYGVPGGLQKSGLRVSETGLGLVMCVHVGR